MTARPIIPGRAYNVDGVAIIADHAASAIVEYLRILSAHSVGLGTAFPAARPAAQAQPQPLATA